MQPQMLKIPLRNPHDCRPKKLKKFLIFYKRFEEKNAQDPRDLRKKCSRSPPSRDPLDYGPKKSKKCSILYARFEKKMLKIPPSPHRKRWKSARYYSLGYKNRLGCPSLIHKFAWYSKILRRLSY